MLQVARVGLQHDVEQPQHHASREVDRRPVQPVGLLAGEDASGPITARTAGVMIVPNLSRFTRWPSGPSSIARWRTYICRAALAAATSPVLLRSES